MPAILLFYAMFGPKFSATCIALFFFWALDVHLKQSHGLGTDTAFVDLSFTALVLSAGLAVDLIARELTQQLRPIDITFEIFVFITLLSAWLVNLSLFKDSRRQASGHGIPKITVIIGLFSAVVVLIAASPLRDILIIYMSSR
jgi:hypothetical protein